MFAGMAFRMPAIALFGFPFPFKSQDSSMLILATVYLSIRKYASLDGFPSRPSESEEASSSQLIRKMGVIRHRNITIFFILSLL